MKYSVKKIVALLGIISISTVSIFPIKAQASFTATEGTVQVQDNDTTTDSGDGYSYETEETEEEPVEEVKIKKISLPKSKLTGYVGEKIVLSPTIKPSNATNQKLTYTSSNKKVAKVSSKGVVTLKKKGTVTITCKAKDGSKKKAKVKITVKKAKAASSSTIKIRTTRPAFSSKYYFSSGNIYYNYDRYAPTRNSFDGGKYCVGNCTWYACGRAWEILAKAKKDVDLSIFGANPYGIWTKNKLTKTYKTGKKPKVGALVIFGPKYGSYHIAVVEKIDGDDVYVSESGYKTILTKPSNSDIVFHYGKIEEWNKNREIIGYIYLLD